MNWYQQALKDREIDYWNFNAVLFPQTRLRRYLLFATRTLKVAKGLGLRRIRRLQDGLYYGVMVRTALTSA